MGRLLALGLPVAPVEVADEVEMWARQSGRHATLRFVPTVIRLGTVVGGTWTVRITLRPDDKRLESYRLGRVTEEPVEVVWLHEPDAESETGYRPYDLAQLGAGGVRTFLEKGNTWSGRGEFASLEDQLRKVNEQNEQTRRKTYAAVLDNARGHARDRRRQILGIPQVPVAADVAP